MGIGNADPVLTTPQFSARLNVLASLSLRRWRRGRNPLDRPSVLRPHYRGFAPRHSASEIELIVSALGHARRSYACSTSPVGVAISAIDSFVSSS